ncbi:regulator of microtubule dynamics protein 2 isoform X1 [Delphinapterus leucas]|uniref:Regulator of microtubule dynamics protein 2 n=1 Tax=Delphinapterus leucas TaxID=9749 RepID=A0A2Y9NKE3_DELLE|nr:regulator of microtubule dynamics protein 2 isoform X1 [Delphinapterus leucas]
MGQCLSCCKEDQSFQPKCPADQVSSDPLHPGASSIIQPPESLDFKTAHPPFMHRASSLRGSKIASSSSNTSSYSSFFGKRHSLFAKFQKSSASLHSGQSRANFDSEAKRSFSNLKSPSEHFRFRSRSLFSAPKLNIISCYESASNFFDPQSRSQCIFNPNEIEIISKNLSITDAGKYISSYSPEYNTKYFMNSETNANSSACRNTVANIYQSTATMLTLPTTTSYSSQQRGVASDIQEREQYITANTDTEEQSFPLPKAFNTHVEELNLDALIQTADNLRMNESRKMESFELLCDHKEKFRDEIEFIWRFARAYGDMYELSTNAQEKKHYANIGKTLGEKAITRAPMNGHCHLWYAVLCGYVSEFEGLQNKINYGYRFKEHLDKAIEFLPEEPFLYYLKGRYCYTVSKLSWIEKKMAATLFGKIPSATVQEALQNFLKVEELHPGFSKSNYMFLAKCYIDLEQTDTAVKFCNMAVLLPCVTKEDKDAQKEVKKINTSLKR